MGAENTCETCQGGETGVLHENAIGIVGEVLAALAPLPIGGRHLVLQGRHVIPRELPARHDDARLGAISSRPGPMAALAAFALAFPTVRHPDRRPFQDLDLSIAGGWASTTRNEHARVAL